MKKIHLAQIPFLLLTVLFLTGIHQPNSQIQTVHAQTAVTPTLYCLGGCPTAVISSAVTAAPSGTGTSSSSSSSSSVSPGTSGTQTSVAPSTTATTPAPSTQPCSSTSTHQNISQSHEGHHHHHKGGFLSGFFQFFLLLIELLLKLVGVSLPCSSTTGPTPVPSISVAPSSSSSSSSQPSGAPSAQPTTVQTTPVPTNGTQGTGTKTPNQILQLTNWYLTLPIGAPTTISSSQLTGGYTDQYFHTDSSNTGVVFHAPVNGATTSGSSYPRSELREMTNNGSTHASWSTSTGTHTMTIDEAITAVPKAKQHVVAGQIHDASNDVIVIRLEMPKLFVDIGGTAGPTLDANYTLGKRFTVKFEVSNGKTNIYYNNSSSPAYTMTKSYSGAYFKAGAYTQSNCTKETQCDANNYGEVTIYNLNVTHQ